jgi:nucleotide-binding universal stress UspA family protein
MGPIVLATCLSKVSESAAKVARALAEETKAPLHVVYALEPMSGLTGDAAMMARESVRARQEGELRGALEAFCVRQGIDVDTTTRRVLSGTIAEEIAAYAADVSARLVVVGTSAPTGVTAVLLGSVADEVMRRCPAPVLIVRQDLLKDS